MKPETRADANWYDVNRSTVSITGKAIITLLQSQGFGDLFRIYLTTLEDGVEYNLAYIDSDFDAIHREEFDREYMQALYRYGFDLAEKGYHWHRYPPGYEPATE